MSSLSNSPTGRKSNPSPYDLSFSTRHSPFARTEQVKREFSSRLDDLLSEYESEIDASLSGADFSPAYRLAEIDAYLARLGSVLCARERQAFERAAKADAERMKKLS